MFALIEIKTHIQATANEDGWEYYSEEVYHFLLSCQGGQERMKNCLMCREGPPIPLKTDSESLLGLSTWSSLLQHIPFSALVINY